jgi:lipoate-protein ligase A
MHVLELTLPSPAENLALDEVLLLEAEAGRAGEALRLWEWTGAAVVLGSGSGLAEEVDEAACEADGVPILRRASGGGTVVLGAGCLCYSLVLSYDRSPALPAIASSYVYILDRVRDALAADVPGIERAGISDLAVAGCKVSGNSQQRKRSHFLHHGTLLYGFDVSSVARYLRLPGRQPDYRRGREHADFLTSLPVDPARLRMALRDAWGAIEEATAWPQDAVRELVLSKYLDPRWIQRR